jgi:hypothetical protein
MWKEEAMAMAMVLAECAAKESGRKGKGKFVPQTGRSLCRVSPGASVLTEGWMSFGRFQRTVSGCG